MNTESSYIADATSDMADQLQTALNKEGKSIDAARTKKLQEIQKRIDDLNSRGLLKKQEYVSVSTSEFEKRYYSYSKP